MKHFNLLKPGANHMERNDEWQQMMEEREQMIEEAFERAQAGTADENDWKLIAGELGLRNIFKEANHANR
jgi:hypothetical protein